MAQMTAQLQREREMERQQRTDMPDIPDIPDDIPDIPDNSDDGHWDPIENWDPWENPVDASTTYDPVENWDRWENEAGPPPDDLDMLMDDSDMLMDDSFDYDGDRTPKIDPEPEILLVPMHNSATTILPGETGLDIMSGYDLIQIKDFISDTQKEENVPVIIKVLDKTGNQSRDIVYLYTKTDIQQMLNASTVYPCWQDTGYKMVNWDREDAPNIPKGLHFNYRSNIPLYTMNSVLQRNLLVTKTSMDNLMMGTEPILIVFAPTQTSYTSLAKLPFSAGISELHCNAGASDNSLIVYSVLPMILNESSTGGKMHHLTRKRNNPKTKTKSKTKPKPKTKSKTKPKTKSKTKTKTKTKSKTKPKTKSKTKTKTKTKPKSKTKTKPKPKTNPA
jgi:hypothetical protein